MSTEIKLTSFSKGAGCGCKIAPTVLQEILKSDWVTIPSEKLLVGNGSNDDAAVYDLGDGNALISSTDFFMPIVDDAISFGKIASANAISDIYAMGGKPILAIAILGWPVEKIPLEVAQKVLDGARMMCAEAGITLAGGHSIDSAEPIFGLSVNGIVPIKNLKKNNTAQPNDVLILTKSIGVGILSTAQKRGLLSEEDERTMLHYLTQLNKVGEQLGFVEGITAMTDVTGFGLLGHLIEMCEGAALSAKISYQAIPKIACALPYLAKQIVPDATYRNWNSYSKHTQFGEGVNVLQAFNLLPDPQTNGGLLISVNENAIDEVMNILNQNGLNESSIIGKMIELQEKRILVEI
jgi:selenide,water dikinase